MLKELLLVTFMVYASAERISHVEPVSWNRQTTTEDYYSGSGRGSGYGSSYDENVRGVGSSGRDRYGSSSSVTDRPGGRFTYSWERDTTHRSSYLDRYTTFSPYDTAYDRDRTRDSSYDRYGSGTSRRPSYQTDRWGDPIGGATTKSYSSWSSDRDSDRIGSSGSRYGSGITTRSWLDSSYSGGMYGSGRDSHSSSSGRGSSPTRFDRNNAYVRVLVELAKLTNDKGLTIDGKKCDTFGTCDPLVYAYIDTDRPNADYPGTIDFKYWPVVYQTDDNNSPDFTRANLTREVCGTPYRDASLRVYIEDDDTGRNDVINKFDCDISREPDSSEALATWHTGSCTSRASNAEAKKMRLSFRYKVFVIPSSRCDSTIGQIRVAGGTTPKPIKSRH